MEKWVKAMKKKFSNILQFLFGWGIFISLFVGGLTFFGYIFALVIGGNVAEKICHFLYKDLNPILIYISTISVVIGLVKMYLNKEVALSSKN